MSNRRVGDWIEGFLEYTDNTEPRESYRRWVGISTIASVLQRKCYVEWGRETFYPNLYIILVGPPAARKGTAMREGKTLLNKIGLKLAADESSRQKLITFMKNSLTQEQTPEGQPYFHCSITIISTELTVFLGYESKELLAVLCKWFDCEDRFLYDTIARDEEEIHNVWANLIGATTPAQLQASLPEGAIGSGFTSRVVFVFEDNKDRIVIKPELTVEQERLGKSLIMDLGDIRNICGEFSTTAGFDELYSTWRQDSETDIPFSEPRLDYYIQRRPTHLFKLCMVYSAARGSGRIITEDDLQTSISVLESAEVQMPRVFEGVGMNPLASAQIRIADLVERRKKVPLSEIAHITRNDLTQSQLSEALSALQQQKLITMDLGKGIVLYHG